MLHYATEIIKWTTGGELSNAHHRRARTSRLLTALGMAGALLSMATPGFAAVTPATLTLSSTQGPNTGGNMITASVPAGSTQFFPGVDVEFQVAASASTA